MRRFDRDVTILESATGGTYVETAHDGLSLSQSCPPEQISTFNYKCDTEKPHLKKIAFLSVTKPLKDDKAVPML